MRLRFFLGLATLAIVVSAIIIVTTDRKATTPGTRPAASTGRNAQSPGPHRFEPIAMGRSFPPLSGFEIVETDRAVGRVDDTETVLGLSINGQARAYPIGLIADVEREIVNDTVAGRPIVVTWCNHYQDGLAFSRKVGDQTLTFFIDGTLWDDNMVMRDVETGTLWSQLLGLAEQGSLEGRPLERLPALLTDWKTWRLSHPSTTVLILPRTAPLLSHQDRYNVKTDPFLLGLTNGETTFTWAFDQLAKEPVVNDRCGDKPILIYFDKLKATVALYSRVVDGRELSFRLDQGKLIDESSNSTWNPLIGLAVAGPLAGTRLEPLAGVVIPKSRWEKFHPKSRQWKAEASSKDAGLKPKADG